jgi:hypothetical protein
LPGSTKLDGGAFSFEKLRALTMIRRLRPHRKGSSPKHRPRESEDDVDLTLIRRMLSLTPRERIRTLQDSLYALARLKNGKVST